MDVITRWQKFPTGLILCDCPYERIPLFTDILLHSSSLGKHTTRIFIAKYFSVFCRTCLTVCLVMHIQIYKTHIEWNIFIYVQSQKVFLSLYVQRSKSTLAKCEWLQWDTLRCLRELVARRGWERISSLILSRSIVNLSIFVLGKHKIGSEEWWYSMWKTTKGKIR